MAYLNNSESIRGKPVVQVSVLLLFCLGVALNHSSVLFGVNLSVADLFAGILLAVLILTLRLYVPLVPTVFFVALSVLVILMGGFIIPAAAPIPQTASGVLVEYVKLLTSFGYFLLGLNLARLQQARTVLRALALVAASVGLVGIIQSALPSLPRMEFMFYSEFRFRGLMNDPNYFAVIQLAALALLWHDTAFTKKIRYPALVLLATSVLISGSKTGTIAMLAFLLWRLGSNILSYRRERSLAGTALRAMMFPAILAGILVLTADPTWRFDLAMRMEQIPALDRLAPLLVDFQGGLTEAGSSRDSSWANALIIIAVSPLTGIGIGTYLPLSSSLIGEAVLAHNTFLQMAAEWGIVLTLLFFAGLLILVVKPPDASADLTLWRATRDSIIVMLIGSVGISLNNARLFWFTVGILLAVHLGARFSERSSELNEPPVNDAEPAKPLQTHQESAPKL